MNLQVEQDQKRGRKMQQAGAILLALGFISICISIAIQTGSDPTASIVPALFTPLACIAGAFLLYRGKQFVARSASKTITLDNRPPVVYLRPFVKDASMASQVFSVLFTATALRVIASNEEQLAEAVSPIGPLVAIGQPGEKLPKPGAIRTYASDDEWQAVVDHWLSIAQLVILQPGVSKGVWWEIERAITTVKPDRFLILMLGVKRAEYEALAENMRAKFGIILFNFDKIKRWDSVSGFFEFNDNREVNFMPLIGPYWHISPYKAERHLFHYALRPVFIRLGIDWKPSPISIGKIAAISFLALLGLCFFTSCMLTFIGFVFNI